jgi:SPX domain protein involved in polyphosphate accumulation
MEQFSRYEFKYPMSTSQAQAISRDLRALGMEPDPFSARNADHRYTVSSLYFDSVRMNDYGEKAGGFLKRKKNRIRIYTPQLDESTTEIWLEQKGKYEMRVSKDRVRLSREQYDDLVNGFTYKTFRSLATSEHQATRHIFYSLFAEAMRPKIFVRYTREPLFSPKWKDLRITFDTNIEACETTSLCYPRFMHRVSPGTVVMEVKFSVLLPGWLKNIIQSYNLERTTFSKYGLSVESIYRYHPIPR